MDWAQMKHHGCITSFHSFRYIDPLLINYNMHACQKHVDYLRGGD